MNRKSKEYRKAYEENRITIYNPKDDSYTAAQPLKEVVVTPSNNLDLGSVIREGTSKIAKPINMAIVDIASLHPLIGMSRAWIESALPNKTISERIITGASVLPLPGIGGLLRKRKIINPVTKVIEKTKHGDISKITLKTPDKELGYIELHPGKGMKNHIDYIKVNEQGKGLSKALYASAIEESKKPLVSGEVLLHPDKTTRTYKYFEGPELPPLINEEGFNYNRKIMMRPKDKHLYEDTIRKYEESNARYSNNLVELWNKFRSK